MFSKGPKYENPPLQCFHFLEDGHIAARCKAESATCVKCGANHDSRECKMTYQSLQYIKCIHTSIQNSAGRGIDQEAKEFSHSSMSAYCTF
ncbi:hypothetical protein CROQUDRAFT_46621 [Cronartium quercuum f. sp. fusiforme G11]|uniref:Uncharacterized protein n=1 Tax=Cronartium quercuum f. sp. fusiforme G11 TaxID=708437 RepID=A0A9P6TAQ3_9BASI|nr:hypothetical protein CROQUDRAFT_46621 [Cronartium quercuum f. sp. fusiforme G11]